MKIKVLIILLLFTILIISACSNSDDVSGYFPPLYNTILNYEIEGTNNTWRAFQIHINENRIQRLIEVNHEDFQGSSQEIVEINDDGVVFINFAQTAAAVNLTDLPPQINTLIFQNPIETGASWHRTPNTIDTAVAEITGVGIDVVVPAGIFNAIEMTVTSPLNPGEISPARLQQYFAYGIGLVKEIATDAVLEGQTEPAQVAITRLVSIENGPIHTSFHIIFNGELFEAPITFETNADLAPAYTQALQHGLQTHFGIDPEGIYINFIIVNLATNHLNIDFSAETLERINALDSELSESILTAINHTFLNRFMPNSISVTFDGAFN